MTDGQAPLELFQQYNETATQYAAIVGVLEANEFVDNNVRAAYMAAHDRLKTGLASYHEQADSLVEGALAAGDLAVRAVDQLKGVQSVLPPDVLATYAEPYRQTLARAANLLQLHRVEGDERSSSFADTLRFISDLGAAGVKATVAVEVTEPARVAPAEEPVPGGAVEDARPTEDVAGEATPGEPKAGAEADAAGSADEGRPAEPPTTHDERFAAAVTVLGSIGPGEARELRPSAFWELVTGTPYTTYNRHALNVLTERLAGVRAADDQPVFATNGARGGGTLYVLRGGPDIVAPGAEAPPENDFLTITITDAQTLATFFGMYREIIEHKGLPALDGGIIGALLDAEVSTESAPLPAEVIRESRAASFEKMWELARDETRMTAMLESLPADDPRGALLRYVRRLDGRLEELRMYLTTYKALQVAVTVRHRSGPQLGTLDGDGGVYGVVVDGDGSVIDGGIVEKRQGVDLRAVAADERVEVIATQDPATIIYDIAAQLAGRARTCGLSPGRPYMPAKLLGAFPALAGKLPDTGGQSDTRTLMDAIVMTLQTQQPELLSQFETPERVLSAVRRGVDAAYVPKKSDPLLSKQG